MRGARWHNVHFGFDMHRNMHARRRRLAPRGNDANGVFALQQEAPLRRTQVAWRRMMLRPGMLD
ncbi:MAG: hypothetical protein WCA36_07025 [Pseudolabrys sp.]